MTMTPPASPERAARVRRHRAAAPRRLVRAAVVTAAVLALVAPLTGVGGSMAVAATTVSSASSVEFGAAAAANGILRSDGQLVVTLSASNLSPAVVDAATVDLSVSSRPLDSRDSVDQWLSGESAPSLRGVGSLALGSIGPYGTTSAQTMVEVGDELDPGVYALRAAYRTEDSTLLSRGVFVVPADDDPTGEVAVLVPITAGPLTAGLLTADELAVLTADGGDLRVQLDAVTGTVAILAIDPAIPAAIRVLGSGAPETALQWLSDLMALPNTRFALQFGDADLAVQYAAGLEEPLTVSTLSPYVDIANIETPDIETPDTETPATETPTPPPPPTPTESGDGAPAAVGTPTPTNTPTSTNTPSPEPTPPADGIVLPSLEHLTDIGPSVADVYWPASGTADTELVSDLADTGDDRTTLTIVPSNSVDRATGARARTGTAQLLVYDSAVSGALKRASVSEIAVGRAGALAEASAYGAFTDPDATLLVTFDRTAGPARSSESAMHAAIRAASSLDGRSSIGLTDLAAESGATRVRLAEVEDAPERVSALQRLLDDEGDLEEFATILTDPSLILAPERASILQLLGNAWMPSTDAWTAAVSAHEAATVATIEAVSIVPSPAINLLGTAAPLNFSVRNDLQWPVSLVLVTQPNDPRLVVQNTTEFVAGAAQTTRVDVPVEARVGNGESSLTLQLRSPAMIRIGDPVTVEVSVRAEWETVGIVIMSVLVGGFIVLGAIRTVVRLRQRRRAAGGSNG